MARGGAGAALGVLGVGAALGVGRRPPSPRRSAVRRGVAPAPTLGSLGFCIGFCVVLFGNGMVLNEFCTGAVVLGLSYYWFCIRFERMFVWFCMSLFCLTYKFNYCLVYLCEF
jgi:hypothetical protein